MTKELLRHVGQERTAAQSSPISPSSLEILLRCIDLPEDVRRLNILEIGAGASTATLELRRRGANAVAIDHAYGAPRNFTRSLNQYLQRLASLHGEFATRRMRKAGEEFVKTRINGEGRYVAALAGFLPFRDESFEVCYSTYCLSEFLTDEGFFVVRRGVSEALRVIKPGGELLLFPWGEDRNPFYAEEQRNAQKLLSELKESGISYSTRVSTRVLPEDTPYLVISKPR